MRPTVQFMRPPIEPIRPPVQSVIQYLRFHFECQQFLGAQQSPQLYNVFFLVNNELRNMGQFELLDLDIDEKEHSIEMQLPYVAKIMQR